LAGHDEINPSIITRTMEWGGMLRQQPVQYITHQKRGIHAADMHIKYVLETMPWGGRNSENNTKPNKKAVMQDKTSRHTKLPPFPCIQYYMSTHMIYLTNH